MPFYTQTDIENFKIRSSAPLTENAVLTELIQADKTSDEKKLAQDGDRYFRARHDILDEDFTLWTDPETGKAQKIPNRANNKIPHPFHRRQVLEKTTYLFKSPITITHKDDDPDAEQSVATDFTELLGTEFDSLMQDTSEDASNKGRAFLMPFFDAEEWMLQLIDSLECIPIYESSKQNMLESLIRYFPIELDVAGDKILATRAEWWFKDKVRIFESTDDGTGFKFIREEPHFFQTDNQDGGSVVEAGWGRVPFVEFRNNKQALSDLCFIRAFVDTLDRINSKFGNDLEDFQEALVKATGTSEDAAELMYNLRFHKAATTPDPNADIDFLTLDMPFEAKKQYVNDLEESIATHGMGINPKTDEFGNDPSGAALRWLYLPLDLKTSPQEEKFKAALYQVAWFANKAGQLMRGKNPLVSDEKELQRFSFVFNKSMIANEDKKIEQANNSVDKISERTRLENDPRVEDVEKEMELMEEERKKKAKEAKANAPEVPQLSPGAADLNGNRNVPDPVVANLQ